MAEEDHRVLVDSLFCVRMRQRDMKFVRVFVNVCLVAGFTADASPIISPNSINKDRPEGRLSLLDWQSYRHNEPEGPGTYAFGYDIEEPHNDNVQFRHEERHSNGSVTGSYGFVSPDGNVHIVNYIADNLGYRASTEMRHGGFLKPVKVDEEQDIQDAIAAVSFAKRIKSNPNSYSKLGPKRYPNNIQDVMDGVKHQSMYPNRYQNYKVSEELDPENFYQEMETYANQNYQTAPAKLNVQNSPMKFSQDQRGNILYANRYQNYNNLNGKTNLIKSNHLEAFATPNPLLVPRGQVRNKLRIQEAKAEDADLGPRYIQEKYKIFNYDYDQGRSGRLRFPN